MNITRAAFTGLLGLALGAILLLSDQAYGAAYLKFGDIKGEATDQDHKDWINLLSVSWGDGQHGARPPRAGAGVAKIVKQVDRASPGIMEYCGTNRSIPEVRIDDRGYRDMSARGRVVTGVTLHDVRVGACTRSAGADDRPTEEVAFYYNKISFNYEPAARPARLLMGRQVANPMMAPGPLNKRVQTMLERGQTRQLAAMCGAQCGPQSAANKISSGETGTLAYICNSGNCACAGASDCVAMNEICMPDTIGCNDYGCTCKENPPSEPEGG